MPVVLRYARRTRIQVHRCATAAIADAVESYIASRYDAVPVDRCDVEQLTLDPGGPVFGTHLPRCGHPTIPWIRIHPSHVRAVLGKVADTVAGRCPQRLVTYGDVPTFRMGGFHHLVVLPANVIEPLEAWLVSLLPEGDQVVETACSALRESGAPVLGLPVDAVATS